MKMKEDVQGKSTETNIDVFRGVSLRINSLTLQTKQQQPQKNKIKLYEKRAILLMTEVQSDEQ